MKYEYEQNMNKKQERTQDTADKKILRSGTGNFETFNGKKKSPQFKYGTEDKIVSKNNTVIIGYC